MRIDALLKADLTALKFTCQKDTRVKLATAKICFRIDQKSALVTLGDEFNHVAFGLMRLAEDGEGHVFHDLGYSELRPHLVCEIHTMSIVERNGIIVQPVVKKIRPGRTRLPECEVEIDLPIIINSPALAGALACALGAHIEIQLRASQQELPGMAPPEKAKALPEKETGSATRRAVKILSESLASRPRLTEQEIDKRVAQSLEEQSGQEHTEGYEKDDNEDEDWGPE